MTFGHFGRREFITLLAGSSLAWPRLARAQTRAAKVGLLVLTQADADTFGKSLRDDLRELGLVDGRNVGIEVRSAGGSAAALPGLAAELVRLNVDVIIAVYTPCATAAKQATRDIPIVGAVIGDPVASGLVTSLARPGANVTGLSNMAPETAGKSVELFRDMLPSLRRVGVLANPIDPFTKRFLEEIHLAGRAGGIEVGPVANAQGENEVEAAFASIANERADAVVVQGIFFAKTMADLAIRHRLPSASVLRSFTLAGGLMSYGADIPDLFRRTATLVQKILQGAKPADLPVEQPTKFNLTINLKTAKAIGLAIPEAFLLRANEVME